MTIFRRHPTLFAKIISVVVACALWLYVINEQNPPIETTFNITVEQHNLGPKLIVTGMPEKIKLKVRAPRTVLSKISASDLKAYVEAFLESIGIKKYQVYRSENTSFHPGRSVDVKVGRDLLGTYGEIHPDVAENLDIKKFRVYVAEFDAETLEKYSSEKVKY